jgi:hypothetical protein
MAELTIEERLDLIEADIVSIKEDITSNTDVLYKVVDKIATLTPRNEFTSVNLKVEAEVVNLTTIVTDVINEIRADNAKLRKSNMSLSIRIGQLET